MELIANKVNLITKPYLYIVARVDYTSNAIALHPSFSTTALCISQKIEHILFTYTIMCIYIIPITEIIDETTTTHSP